MRINPHPASNWRLRSVQLAWVSLVFGVLTWLIPLEPVYAQVEWNQARFVERAQEAWDLAERGNAPEAAEDGTRETLLDASVVAYRECVDLLHAFLDTEAGQEPSVRDAARTQLMIMYDNTTELLVDLDRCPEADETYRQALAEAARESISAEAVALADGFVTDAAVCLARHTAGLGADAANTLSSLSSPVVVEPSPVASGAPGREIAQWTLIGTGAALILGGVVYDRVLAGDADEFDALQADCAEGPCDSDRARALQSTLRSGKVGVGTLVGVGVAAALTGTILWLTGGDGQETHGVTAAPLWRGAAAGVELGVAF